MKATDDLVRIAAAGGIVHLGDDTTKATDDLIRIASAARQGQGGLKFNGTRKATDDLIRIASAGRGRVEILIE